MKTMKTCLVVLMGSVMLAGAADAKSFTRVELHPSSQPIAPIAPVAPGSTDIFSSGMIIQMLPGTQVASGLAKVQFAVRAPQGASEFHLAQLRMGASLLGQRSIAPGTSVILAGAVKADGQSHPLLVSVYRLQGAQRILVAERSFAVMFPSTAP